MAKAKSLKATCKKAIHADDAMERLGLARDHPKVFRDHPQYATVVKALVSELTGREPAEGGDGGGAGGGAARHDPVAELVERNRRGLIGQGELFPAEDAPNRRDDELIDAIAAVHAEMPVGEGGEMVPTRTALRSIDLLPRAASWLNERAVAMRAASNQENRLVVCVLQLMKRARVRSPLAAE